MSKTNLLTKFPDLYGAFQSTFTTDMSVLEMLDLMNWGTNLDAGSVRAGGLGLNDLQSYTTAEGASVLRVADPGHVRAVAEGIWSAPAMVDANRQDATHCQPLPAGVTFNTASTTPDLSAVDPEAVGVSPAGAPAPADGTQPTPADAAAQAADGAQPLTDANQAPADGGQPPAAAPSPTPESVAMPAATPTADSSLPLPTPTPAPQASSLLLPTPTPAPISISDLPPASGG